MAEGAAEEKALKISMVGAFLLALWGIIMAGVTDSGIILLDGMFNLISAVMSFFSIEITRLVTGKETRDYPLGYFAFESLFVFTKGASILVLVLMALFSNIRLLLSGGRVPVLGLMTVYVIFAVAACVVLYILTRRGYKKTGSEILEAETRSWLINAIVSGAIGFAFGIVLLIQETSIGWIDRYVDQILVIIFSILFIKDPLVLMRKGLRELLLAAPMEELAKPFQEKLLPMKKELKAKDMALEIIKTGRRIWITIRIDPETDMIDMNAFM